VEKFWKALGASRSRIEGKGKNFPLAPDFSLHIHHYISSSQARTTIDERLARSRPSARARALGSRAWRCPRASSFPRQRR
jgi:hypothetical protein